MARTQQAINGVQHAGGPAEVEDYQQLREPCTTSAACHSHHIIKLCYRTPYDLTSTQHHIIRYHYHIIVCVCACVYASASLSFSFSHSSPPPFLSLSLSVSLRASARALSLSSLSVFFFFSLFLCISIHDNANTGVLSTIEENHVKVQALIRTQERQKRGA